MTSPDIIYMTLWANQRKLRLSDWDLRYDPKWDDSPEESANCHFRLNERVATIRLDPEVKGRNLDAHIVHELMHLVLADYTHTAMTAIAAAGPGAERVLDILGDMEERICDTIAHALTGVTYIPVGSSKDVHAPFLDTTDCTD